MIDDPPTMIDADCRLVRDWGIKNARPLLKGRVQGPRYHPSFPGRRRRRDGLTTDNGVYRRALLPAAPGVGGGQEIRRAAPGRVRGSVAAGLAPTAGSLGAGWPLLLPFIADLTLGDFSRRVNACQPLASNPRNYPPVSVHPGINTSKFLRGLARRRPDLR